MNYQILIEKMNEQEYVFVDLDGTLIMEELVKELILKKIRNPLKAIWDLWKNWNSLDNLHIGRKNYISLVKLGLKIKLANQITTWTYRHCFVKALKNTTSKFILITGSCEKLGQKIADQLGIFDKIYGSNLEFDCIGLNKLKIMLNYVDKPFYIGNSYQDLPIFQATGFGCLITTNKKLLKNLPSDVIHINE